MSGLLDGVRSFLRAEARNVRRYDVPWERRLWLYAHGFLSSKAPLWDLREETVDQYLSDVEYRSVNGLSHYAEGLGNKLLFHLLLAPSHGAVLPTLHGLVREGHLLDTARFDWATTFDDLHDRIRNGSIVAKPITGAQGNGVRILDSDDGAVRIDGTPVPDDELLSRLPDGQDLLLEEHVSAADYASEVFPQSTNTLRLLTMIDPASGTPFVAAASHRFGTAQSGTTDNWSAGGLSAGVDLDTGQLGAAVTSPAGEGRPGTRLARHPDTGARISGVEVPGWERVKATVRDLAGAYGWLWPHVGWDVVVRTDAGEITVLEGDPQSVDPDQQAHGPLLTDERARRFYEHHGVLSNPWRRWT
ncbi:sugar-transfer associated ATP-grasp domain-containing protein [Halomicroarcula sp. GCM10025709]|uniref:sugar-transfer associated ATP-grasp domain-containing protein n=1 Tax=Haloarcula TaxID=2237 RepID=UPI0024C25B5F|nr:sugar-transfer associated ATP-grasp domain-containing protein [Halomicroarcula sp. YJ-61-S]